MAADPLIISLPADQWTKIATAVIGGCYHKKSGKPSVYLQTYRVVSLANSAPTLESEGVPVFLENPTEEPIGSDEPIDIYLWPKDAPGKIRVAV